MLTLNRPCSLDHAQDVDATLTWGGVGWGGDVNVPSTTFPRPCARYWCYAHVGWGGDVITFLPPRSLDLDQDADATYTWGGVWWGGDVNVPSTMFPWPCTRCWCYPHMGWGGDVITLERSFDHVPSTFRKMLMLRSHGVGLGGMLTCLRPHSLDLSQDVDATLTWGGVGWDVNVPSTTFPTFRKMAATLTWGGFGWDDTVTFLRPRSTFHKILMLRSHGVGWGDGNAHLMLRPRWSNYHGLRWGGVGAFAAIC